MEQESDENRQRNNELIDEQKTKFLKLKNSND